MAKVIHGVFRSDRMYGTDVAPNLISVRYMGAGSTATDIDNGNIVKLDGLMEGQREVYKGVTPSISAKLGEIAIVASPEVMYSADKQDLSDFYNQAGENARAYILHEHDIFSVTPECFDAESLESVAVGWVMELQAGTKMKAVASKNSATVVGKIIEIEVRNRRTYYVVQVM